MSEIDEINESFLHHCEEFIDRNSFMTLFITDIAKINFIFYIANKAFKTLDSGSSRFEPNPINYFPKIYNDDISVQEIQVFFDIVSNCNEFYSLIVNGAKKGKNTTDREIFPYLSSVTSIGIKFVYLLYFVIFTNTTTFTKQKVNGVSENLKLRAFSVSHSTEKEQEFYDIPGESKILMHGTNIANLYSMMRNGVRSMSKNPKYKTNGAVHGPGIYLTDSVVTAVSYGQEQGMRSIGTNKGSILNDGKENTACILYFNVKRLNPKNAGWCYVQQDDEVILRCILWYDKADVNLSTRYDSDQNSVFTLIHKYAEDIKYTPIETRILKTPENKDGGFLQFPSSGNEPINGSRIIQLARFRKETDRFLAMANSHTDSTFIKANFAFPSDNSSPLLISIMPDKDTQLYNDLVTNNIPGILLAVYFPAGSEKALEYPNVPFRMRVVSPIFVRQTGLVTEGGSICNEQLYQNGWSPALTIEVVIRNFATETGQVGTRMFLDRIEDRKPGRVDINRLGEHYTYEKYLRSHDQIAGFHGWQATSK